jgi:hypothetical protein
METPREIEGAMPPLQIDWVPINADQSVAEAVVVQPKLVAARFFGMPEEGSTTLSRKSRVAENHQSQPILQAHSRMDG